MSEIEKAYASGSVTNADVAAFDSQYYRGLAQADISAMLDDIPVIGDIAQTVAWLDKRGIPSVICTLAWQSVGEHFARRYGFVASSGPTLMIGGDGLYTGEVDSDFTEYDKPVFVAALCGVLGIGMSDVFHVGDSRSDVPLFEAVGYSVALNASPVAIQAARAVLETDSLLDVLSVIPGLRARAG